MLRTKTLSAPRWVISTSENPASATLRRTIGITSPLDTVATEILSYRLYYIKI
jgi:hypothetical protein